MLQHQILQSPARLGMTNPNSPSLRPSTPLKFPSFSTTHHLHHHSAVSSTFTATTITTIVSSSAPTSSTLLPLLPSLPRAQALLLQMASLASKLFDILPNRSLWLSAFRGSLPTFLASQHQRNYELHDILDLQDDSAILGFANKIKEPERVLDILQDDCDDTCSTTFASQLNLSDILSYDHRISYTTFAPPEFGAGQGLIRGALPPAPQDKQLRASQLYNFADFDVVLPKTDETKEKKIEAIVKPQNSQSVGANPLANLFAIQGLLSPNITISLWLETRDIARDAVPLPMLDAIQVPRIEQQPLLSQGLCKPYEPAQVRHVELDILDQRCSYVWARV
ncbi:hypothetical protein ACOSP7_020097 [Xanthoceras sorbifolium]